jgi:ParB-like chromosome segregation protein Spo0J
MPNPAKLVVDYGDYPPHPLATMFPLIEGKEFEDLKDSVRQNRILVPIVLYQGMILDGRNRHAAAKAIGYNFGPVDFKEFEGSYKEAEDFVIGANLARRQLNNKQKQDVIRKMIAKYPDLSNRQIAKKCGLSAHSTVAEIREKVKNPPELKVFRQFKTTWEDLPDDQREEFVKEFMPDIREIMNAIVDGSSSENPKVSAVG